MAELATIARPYAEALFAAATDKSAPAGSGHAAQWAPLLDRLAALVAHPEVAAALGNPAVLDQQRTDILAGMVGSALPGPLTEFLRVLVENGRLAALPQIAAQFRARKNASEGAADCLIESAFPLEPAALASLVAALGHKFPLQLKPEVRINPQLIGGVRVTVGDRVLDNSVRARLDAMQARLTA